jgi:copper(I)-binding protein
VSVLRILIAAALLPFVAIADARGQTPGDVTISNVWARATPGGARTGAAFLEATAKSGDRLLAVKSDAAGRVELHNHVHEGDVMRMRRVDAIDLPAGKPVVLAPGGYHVMLMDLKQPLKAGDTLALTLVFEKAGEIAVKASIQPIGAKGPAGAVGGAPAGKASGHKH